MKMRGGLGGGRVHGWPSLLAQALGEEGPASDSNIWSVLLARK